MKMSVNNAHLGCFLKSFILHFIKLFPVRQFVVDSILGEISCYAPRSVELGS